MVSAPIVFGCLVYAAIALMTFGHFLRHGRKTLVRRCVYGVAAVAWPIFWLVVPPPKILFGIMWSDEVIGLYAVTATLFPAFYLYQAADQCTSIGPCAFAIFKAVLWAPFWPAYLIAALASAW